MKSPNTSEDCRISSTETSNESANGPTAWTLSTSALIVSMKTGKRCHGYHWFPSQRSL